ncbi:MAG: class I SAM-dependent methyltransferase [Actinomycetota bacterium]|nr:class I SAM-dependent methyltransferase [Actinomycetota bacterium]
MYDAGFFELIRAGSVASADAIVPLVIDELFGGEPGSVIDVGCGEGWFAKRFEAEGWAAVGVDGAETPCLLDRWVPRDLRRPLDTGALGQFDLAVCLEVAEHLPADRADGLVAELCELAPIVLFSAATPGQGGVGHINEQWPDYWSARFEAYGRDVSGFLRWRIWDHSDPQVQACYRQNLLVAGMDLWTDDCPPRRVVHPTIWEAHR